MVKHAPNIGIGIGISLRPARPGFSAEASNYFSRLDTAGDTTYTDYKQPIANYIDGLVANGMWDGLETAALFVGVGLEGITVPLRSDMPTITNNNFVSGDLNVLTGLKGDASTKSLTTNLLATQIGTQNDASVSVYVTETWQTEDRYFAGSFSGSDTLHVWGPTNATRTSVFGALHTFGTKTLYGLAGGSRSDSANVISRANQTNYPASIPSTTPIAAEFYIFSTTGGFGKTDARLATYHAGASLDLATLETLQATLISEIAAI